MGQSWYTYAGTLYKVEKGYLLIPKYAQSFFKADKLLVESSTNYNDFEMAETPSANKNKKYLNGHVLSGIFQELYFGSTPKIALEDCYFEENKFPDDNEDFSELRTTGIFNNADWQNAPFSIKVVPLFASNLTYETCATYSPSTQQSYFPVGHEQYDPDREEQRFKELKFYFKPIVKK